MKEINKYAACGEGSTLMGEAAPDYPQEEGFPSQSSSRALGRLRAPSR